MSPRTPEDFATRKQLLEDLGGTIARWLHDRVRAADGTPLPQFSSSATNTPK